MLMASVLTLPNYYFCLENSINTPDFICVQETWIYSDLIPDIPGYDSVHTYRTNKKGGGSAIYVKNNIEYNKIEQIKFENIDIEVAGITFKSNKKEEITLLSIYIAPGQTLKIEHLKKLNINEHHILVGALNAKHMLWGSPVNDFRGKTIAKFIDEQNMGCLNKRERTRLNYNATISHLDLAICSAKLGYHIECDVINDA